MAFSDMPLPGTAPLTVQFTDTSTNAPTSWSWSFGDGGTSTAQNPSHQYTSAGTYSVSLTAANAAGSDGETKTGYVVVTNVESNQATDVAGRDVTLTDAENAASQQESMNYQAEIFYHATPSDNVQRLPNDQIFFFFGHGTKGAIQINDINLPSDLNLLYGSNMPNSFDEASTSYSNMKLGVLLACKAGGTDPIYGNIVDVLASKGASCAMGWTENIETAGASAWSSTFWNRIQDGDIILYAYDEGLGAASSLPVCESIYSLYPTQWDSACNLTNLYYLENDNGCSQSLSNVLERQTGSEKIAAAMTKIKSAETMLSGEKENQIITSVSLFAKKPVNEIQYKDVIHQPYADVYHVKEGNSSYWIDANNERVQTMTVSETESTTTRIINLKQGSKIAEEYAKEKYPELWNVSETKGIKQTVNRKNDQGSDQTYEYSWQEIFYNPVPGPLLNSEISGPKLVTIKVSPFTGRVVYYHEWYTPSSSGPNLVPTLTEEEAMRNAESYFQKTGFKNIKPDQIYSHGLNVAIDENNTEQLTWSFELELEDAYDFNRKGFVGINAHNGEVVWHASIA